MRSVRRVDGRHPACLVLLLVAMTGTACSSGGHASPQDALAGMGGSESSSVRSTETPRRATGGNIGNPDSVVGSAGNGLGSDEPGDIDGGPAEVRAGSAGALAGASWGRGGNTGIAGGTWWWDEDGGPIGHTGHPGDPGSAGSANTTGRSGGPGGDNAGPPPQAAFNVISASPSSAIPTVGVVEWSTDLDHLDGASIEFSLVDPKPQELNRGTVAPVDLRKPNYRTLLLGLKAQRTYRYQIIAKAGGYRYQSQDFYLTAGPIADDVPTIGRQVQRDGARSKGYIVTSQGLGGNYAKDTTSAFIVDTDGDVVWWSPAPSGCSRAIMSYDGTEMWMVALNLGSGGEVRRVSMDGLDVTYSVPGLSSAHHDITVLPDGMVAALCWSKADDPSYIVEWSQDGTTKKVLTLDNKVYASLGKFHANSIHYWASDDAYTVSDRYGGLFVKVKRRGDEVWQFGGDCSSAPARRCVPGDWSTNHGHHLLNDGTFLFFSNGSGSEPATVFEYKLNESNSSLIATQNWSYSANDLGSIVFGDVQRLPNGNTLVTFSTDGVLDEIDASRSLVQRLWTDSLGYADFRESLYGAPSRK